MTKHDEIAETLAEEILSERFRPGERLPSERDLALRFDANRGAVREAMKKVAQMGLATIQPGGARVEPLENASFDVIGRLLDRPDGPDTQLISKVLEVMSAVAQIAMSHVIESASAAQITDIRERIQPLMTLSLDTEAHAIKRMEVLRAIMLASDHLVCQIIARSLFEQLILIAGKHRPGGIDLSAYRDLMVDLDTALAKRDRTAALTAMEQMNALNQAGVLAAVHDDNGAHVVEVSI